MGKSAVESKALATLISPAWKVVTKSMLLWVAMFTLPKPWNQVMTRHLHDSSTTPSPLLIPSLPHRSKNLSEPHLELL